MDSSSPFLIDPLEKKCLIILGNLAKLPIIESVILFCFIYLEIFRR